MMNAMTLSIIIPFYNLEEWLLARCLDSIICQQIDCKTYEIIIIDDGSVTFPHHLLKRYNQNNIIYFHQNNKGLGEARNTGMKISKGQYIQFIDGDDYLFENTLSQYFPLLMTGDFDVICFDFRYTMKKEREHINSQKNLRQIFPSGAEFMLSHNLSGCAWLYAFKKEISTNHDIYFSPGIFHEDEEFTPKLYFFAQKTLYYQLDVYAYYQRPDSIITKKGTEHLNKRFSDFKRVMSSLAAFQEKHKQQSNQRQKDALERKLNLLVCDFLINMFRNHYSYSKIRHELQVLNELKLFPLANKPYSFKYNVFRWLSTKRLGIKALYFIELIRYKLKL